MKKITLKIEAPKCGASSEILRQTIAAHLGAELEYVGGRLAILPPDVKAVVNKVNKTISETYKKLTIPWIGTERVCADDKAELIADEINEVAKNGALLIQEQAEALRARMPELRAALGKGADMVELPDPDDFKLSVTVGIGEPTAAGRGLPRNATEAQVSAALSKAEGYENLINHLIELSEKVGPGKEGSAAALRFKEDAATAAALGVVDKSILHNLNKLTANLLAAGKSGAKKSAAKAALVTAITEGAIDPNTEQTEAQVEKGEVTDAEVVSENPTDAAIALI